MFNFSVGVYFYLICMLPSAVFLDVNIKLYATIYLIFTFVSYKIKNAAIDYRSFGWLLVSIFFIVFYTGISVTQGVGVDDYYSHFMPLILFVFYVFLLNRVVLYRGPLYLLKLLKSIMASLAALKVGVFLLDFFEIFSVDGYILLVKILFKYEVITLKTDVGSRLHQPSDYLFILYPLVLKYERFFQKNKFSDLWMEIKSYSLLILIVLAVLISYSRSLWLFFAINMFVYYLECDFKRFFQFLVLAFLFFVYLGFGDVSDFIRERYVGDFATESDQERVVMFGEMLNSISDNPFFGLGIGGYIANYVRFDELRWNYELQLMSLVVNFGVFGFCALTLLLFYYLIDSKRGTKIGGAVFYSVFISWIAINIFNCFAFTSFGSVISGVLFSLVSKTMVQFIGSNYNSDNLYFR